MTNLKKKTIVIRIEPALYETLVKKAKWMGKTVSAYVRNLLWYNLKDE